MTYPRPITTDQAARADDALQPALQVLPAVPRARAPPKEDMTLETFAAVMDLVEHYVRAGTQGELCFTGIGEPTLHENLPT
jgi:hypothetical protein